MHFSAHHQILAAIKELERQVVECRVMIDEMRDTLSTFGSGEIESEEDDEFEEVEADDSMGSDTSSQLSTATAPATVSYARWSE